MGRSWGSLFWLITSITISCIASSLQDSCREENRRSLNLFRADRSPDSDQPYRTRFHFQPPENWLNDPNGPMYYKGVYHLFYQYNPSGPLFGDVMIWAHSVSYDLINWIQLEHALYPSDSFDINSCWSGSATILPGGKPVIMYTGIDSGNHQVTNIAEPKNISDPLLREWVKFEGNPVMVPPVNVRVDGFRDPTTAWQGQDGRWRVIVGAEAVNSTKGMALLYRSDDFIRWTKFPDPLFESEVTGMWECPDFYPVSVNGTNGVDTSVNNAHVKHVLKAGYGEHDFYVIGTYFPETEKFVTDSDFTNTVSDLRYDHGKFYASKTFFDSAKNRRILWGWVNESDSKEDDLHKGWSGLQSVPRKIWLDQTGKRLVQWPVDELVNLRGNRVAVHGEKLEGGSVLEIPGITASQADVEVVFELPDLGDAAEYLEENQVDPQELCDRYRASSKGIFGPFGVLALASDDLSERTAIFFRVFRRADGYSTLMCSDHSRSSLRHHLDKATFGTFLDIDPRYENISLRCLIDRSVIESYGGGGRSVITSRVYPKLAIGEEAHLYVFNNGTKSVVPSSLEAWSVQNAQINSIEFVAEFLNM
ncbi:PREDICTED: beta-fructofuranosidase, insoluble isoenzyme CWINV6-like [Tarenaya hassleriana]|uniref:beta-fructofuranosidase, insoluble isoenzyme CWINV6-like n=1 Tax=Tarenaya hassleriana TaxID=28532 RepID=UPI00053C7490|nr:PREDICTED: beta-fructofuranosidase, insoluble isoenzyme CWINV6-like [Tarenaya hassleriana]